MNFDSVSILIVNYNVKEYLGNCIDSILQSDYNGEIEIVVVDNHSFDGSDEFIHNRFPDVKMIKNSENLGFGKAVNQAARVATNDYLLILNPDTVIQEDTIATFVHYMKDHPGAGLIGPKILNPDGSLQLTCKRSFPTPGVALPKLLGLSKVFPKSKLTGKYNLTYLDPEEVHSVDAVSGSCMFLQRKLFTDIGGFDERFFMFGEDIDLCYRIKESGKEIYYVPRTKIIHYGGESVKFAPYDSINAFYNAMILFYGKHFSKSQSIFSRLGIRFGIIIRQSLSLIGELKSQIISVFLDAAVVLFAFLVTIPIKFSYYDPITMSNGIIPTVYILFWLIVGSVFQLYGRFILSYTRAVMSSLTGFFVVVVFTFFFKQYAFSRLIILVASGIVLFLIPGWRLIGHYFMSHGFLYRIKDRHNILFTRKTLVVGADTEGIRIAKKIQKRVDSGLAIIGFVDENLTGRQEEFPAPFLGLVDDIRGIIKTHRIKEIIFSKGTLSNKKIVSLMDCTKDLHLTYRMVPHQQDILIGKASVEEIGKLSFIQIEYSLFHRFHRLTKRTFDIIFAAILLILFSPALLFRIFQGLPVKMYFWGESGKKITAYLFPSDSKFIHELLLLWSVFIGDMSFVGASLVNSSEDNPDLICKPGLTGLGRIQKLSSNSDDHQHFDHYYVQNQNITLDIEIMLKTVLSL